MTREVTFKESAKVITDMARRNFSGIPSDFDKFEKVIEQSYNETYKSSLRAGPCKIPRLNWDTHYMLHAHLMATRSTCDRGPELFFDPGRHGVGSVIVTDNRIISAGFNGSPPGEPHCNTIKCEDCGTEYDANDVRFEKMHNMIPKDGSQLSFGTCDNCKSRKLYGGHMIVDSHCVRTLHAEENALLQCSTDGNSAVEATVFTTASPCWDCAKRLARIGISRLIYAEDYGSRYGLSKAAYSLLNRAGIQVIHLDVRKSL
jgi:dCMP deaminase